MKPAAFEYHAPETQTEALQLLALHGDQAKVLAGGQSLVPAMNFRLSQPACLIDLNRIDQLAGITVTGTGAVRIRAMTRQRSLERSPIIAKRAPLLAEAMPAIAHLQIRNRGTIGGSLAHADPAAELPAVVMALDARIRVQRSAGERWLACDDFFVGVLTTLLEPDELLVEVEIPALPPWTGTAFAEVARRRGDYAAAGAAATITLADDGTVARCRLVLFALGDRPLRAEAAERALLGERPRPALLSTAAAAIDHDIDPPSDLHASAAYRRFVARGLALQTLSRAAERAQASVGT